jgi:Nif-specific regulatory protein
LVSLDDQVKAREDNLIRANRSLKAEISNKFDNFFAVNKSPAMVEVQGLIRKVAPTKATVLLLGDSGTGKTLVAQIIHELSSRAKFPFIKVNCAALPDNLLESELFGYEKGAFTGAVESKPGRVEEAQGGTIFLDEIGELSLMLQAKLLRFLQEREFERLGSSKTRSVDVRIIAATNKDLAASVNGGSFREDLFYRLNVFPVLVPSLRERGQDLVPLISFFLKKVCAEYGKSLSLSDAALEALRKYEWPGNVREMENLIERLAIITDTGNIDISHLSPYILQPHKDLDDKEPGLDSLKEMEKKEVIAALERNNWIQSRAAKDLGITLRQMGYRIKKYGLDSLLRHRRFSGSEGV